MRTDDEIFNAYAFKRLIEDPSWGGRLYLDADDFRLSASASLDYLAEVTDMEVHRASPRWMTEKSTTRNGADYYRDETERVYVLDVQDIVSARKKDIEDMLPKLSPMLAKKIQLFEEYTKHLQTRPLSSSNELKTGLNLAFAMLPKELQEKIKGRFIKNKEIKAREGKKSKQTKTERRISRTAQFYEILKAVHQPHDYKTQCKLWYKLLTLVGAQNTEQDIPYVNGGIYRINAELRRDIAVIIKDIYHKNHEIGLANYWQQEIDKYYNDIKRYLKYSRNERTPADFHPFGPNGAFRKGGIYGPDSKFVNPAASAQNIPTTNTNKNTPAPENSSSTNSSSDKRPKVTELLLFSDKDFEM